MGDNDTPDDRVYAVVVNHEEQYSLWPTDRECPAGWREDGKTGSKAECLAYIRDVWVDMRPLSVRKRTMKGSNVAGSPFVDGGD